MIKHPNPMRLFKVNWRASWMKLSSREANRNLLRVSTTNKTKDAQSKPKRSAKMFQSSMILFKTRRSSSWSTNQVPKFLKIWSRICRKSMKSVTPSKTWSTFNLNFKRLIFKINSLESTRAFRNLTPWLVLIQKWMAWSFSNHHRLKRQIQESMEILGRKPHRW